MRSEFRLDGVGSQVILDIDLTEFHYVVIPIPGFLGVQFPDTIGQIFSFLAPGAAGHG
jgi:hypothetical protein